MAQMNRPRMMTNGSLGYLLAIVSVMVICGSVAVLQPAQAVIIVGLGGTVCVGLFNGMQQAAAAKQADQKIDEAAVKVEEVKETAAVVAVSMASIGTAASEQAVDVGKLSVLAEATHTLVNSNYSASLKATLLAHTNNLISLRTIAALTAGKEQKAVALAAVADAEKVVQEAQQQFDEHQAKQAIVDAGATISPAAPATLAGSTPAAVPVTLPVTLVEKP